MPVRKFEELEPDVENKITQARKIEEDIQEKLKKNADWKGNLTNLLTYLDNEHSPVVFVAIKCLERTFKRLNEKFLSEECSCSRESKPHKHYITFLTKKALQSRNNANNDKLDEFAKEKYTVFINRLIQLLGEQQHQPIQQNVMDILFNFVLSESFLKSMRCLPKELSLDKPSVTLDPLLLQAIVHHVVKNDLDEELADSMVRKYINKYDDIRYYTIKTFREIITKELLANQKSEETVEIAKRIFDILPQFDLPTSQDNMIFFTPQPENETNGTSKEGDEDLLEDTDVAPPKKKAKVADAKVDKKPKEDEIEKKQKMLKQISEHKKIFSDCWLSYLRLPLPVDIYKSILKKLDSHIIPFLAKPILLLDFLTHSYNTGGIISMLALKGLFILITKHNLDYPDFFNKLYVLFDNSVFQADYYKKFFLLAHEFLTKATHLPAYLVAAFVKRLARLALNAPPYGTSICLVFIYNLLKRHHAVRPLIHKPQETQVATGDVLLIGRSVDSEDSNKDITKVKGYDPYDFTEKDPAKCNALDSSLWELNALANHYAPAVANLVKIFEGGFNRPYYELSEFIDKSYDTMFNSELHKSKGTTPITPKPSRLFTAQTTADGLWTL